MRKAQTLEDDNRVGVMVYLDDLQWRMLLIAAQLAARRPGEQLQVMVETWWAEDAGRPALEAAARAEPCDEDDDA